MENDQLLCDYIFGLLDQDQVTALEKKLKTSPELSLKLKELNELFGGLDLVKKDFPSPVSKVMNCFYRWSYASATMASAFTIFWATMFGTANGETLSSETVSHFINVESDEQSEGSKFQPNVFQCHDGCRMNNFSVYSFEENMNIND